MGLLGFVVIGLLKHVLTGRSCRLCSMMMVVDGRAIGTHNWRDCSTERDDCKEGSWIGAENDIKSLLRGGRFQGGEVVGPLINPPKAEKKKNRAQEAGGKTKENIGWEFEVGSLKKSIGQRSGKGENEKED